MRNLFFLKPTEEQALLALVKGKGLVVVTGCGHQTAKLLLDYVRLLSNEPIHAIVGGFHLPVAEGRGAYGGIQAQSLIGTGKPPWQSIGEAEIKETIDAFNEIAPKYVYLSAHDSCDHSIERLQREVDAKVEVLRAGGKYRF